MKGDDVGAGVVLEKGLPVALEPGVALQLAAGLLQAEVDAAVDAMEREEAVEEPAPAASSCVET